MGLGGALKSVGGAFGSGLNLGTGRMKLPGAGIGAALTFGAAGAAIGASTSAMFSNNTVDPVTGAVAGGLAGAAALPAAGLAVGTIGSAGVGAAKLMPGMVAGIGKGAAAASPYVAGMGVTAAENVASRVWNVGSKLVNWDESADALAKVKFTGPISGAASGWNSGKAFKGFKEAEGFLGKSKALGENAGTLLSKTGNAAKGTLLNGKVLIGGITAIEGMKKAWGTLEHAKMGSSTGVTTLTPQMQTMTPQAPSYSNNAGATGDLVFALNANRRG